MQKSDYVTILIESLEKKVDILNKIIDKDKVQRTILTAENVSADEFERNLDEKSELIEDINKLDDGFEEVYNRIKDEFTNNKELYVNEIKKLQELITIITEKSNTIQIQEKRNRDLAEKQFTFIKDRIRKVQTGKKVANQYYQNMAKLNYVSPQFVDRKK